MRRTLGGLLALALAATAAGCSIGGPKPDPVAQSVAQALGRYDVASVDFAGPDASRAQRDVTQIAGDLKSLPVKVTVDQVRTDHDRATARLTWTRSAAGRQWVTRSPMSLVRTKDTWQVVWRPSLLYPGVEEGQALLATTLLARRGDILGANDHRIVTPRAVDRIGIDKTRVTGAAAVASARTLARLVGVEVPAFAKRVKQAGATSFVEAITYRRGASDEPRAAQVSAIPGAVVVPALQPLAPTRGFAAPILGTVGQPTAEMIKKSKGALQVGDQVGLTGLEARYDDQLTGTPGVRIDLVDTKADTALRTLFRAEPVAGKPLGTTLDITAQTLAEKALAGTTSPSALVAIRPSSGDILAAASGPASKGYNTATYGRYAPGSTFKVVSSLALLRSGLTPDTVVDCPPTLDVDGKRFKNYSDYPSTALGRIPFRTAIANSCNTAVIGQRGRLEPKTLTDAAAALGLGVDHDLGFPAYFGSAPKAGSETEAAADLIGQGKVQASPLAMAVVAASVRRGSTVLPRLLPASSSSSPAEPKVSVPLTSTEAIQLRTLMRGVVTAGSGRLLLDVPGAPVLAKTGTAEYGASGPGGALKTHAWMIAVHGDLAVAVFVEDGQSGSGTAGPILKRFLLGFR